MKLFKKKKKTTSEEEIQKKLSENICEVFRYHRFHVKPNYSIKMTHSSLKVMKSLKDLTIYFTGPMKLESFPGWGGGIIELISLSWRKRGP